MVGGVAARVCRARRKASCKLSLCNAARNKTPSSAAWEWAGVGLSVAKDASPSLTLPRKAGEEM